ncbi:MAG: SWIB/MDM2 domain-containing protein [Pseudomonadota bacterium]|nr:SWIB/MDM2 domain-containing protein [Pseudomonadota bacterium]
MATAKKAPAKEAPAKKAAPAKKIAVKAATAPQAAAPKTAAKKVAEKKVASAPEAPAAKKRTPNPAFMKALTLSPELSAVVGDKPLPRTEIVSKLWVYIKANDLQDKSNKRMINADKKLLAVFGKAQVSMFEMAGLIGKHVK